MSTAELLRRGFDSDTIKLVASYRSIVPIRHGWYASPELPEDCFRAWRVGGPLTCISAAIHFGIWRDDDAGLHVRVAANASRVRREEGAVVHWSRSALTGTRRVVSLGEALDTIRRCQPVDVFHAIRRAANRYP